MGRKASFLARVRAVPAIPLKRGEPSGAHLAFRFRRYPLRCAFNGRVGTGAIMRYPEPQLLGSRWRIMGSWRHEKKSPADRPAVVTVTRVISIQEGARVRIKPGHESKTCDAPAARKSPAGPIALRAEARRPRSFSAVHHRSERSAHAATHRPRTLCCPWLCRPGSPWFSRSRL
jgi:hypothetical protein